tara:strand:+ start:111 stop:548 length:438 start_codon:yes stop_codon:yes gene_type:complete
MNKTIRLEGDAALQKAFKKLSKDAALEVGKAIDATGLKVRGEIIKKYQKGPKTGIVYELSNPTRIHRASAAGQPPATDTGRLANSIVYDKKGPLTCEVSTDVKYGPWLEFGTMKIMPRPNWVPTIKENEKSYLNRIEQAIKRASK